MYKLKYIYGLLTLQYRNMTVLISFDYEFICNYKFYSYFDPTLSESTACVTGD